MQKRIITKSTKTASCHTLFKELNILPLQAQYILSMSMFVIANKQLFTFNSQMHNCNTRTNYDLYCLQTNLAKFKKEYVVWELRSLIICQTNTKSRSNDFNFSWQHLYYKIPFIHVMNFFYK
jgi:hypothetical protein